ncbi:MAG: molybdenum cofactor guanylyltransferase [Cyanobacteriota bacterium]
MNQHKYTAIILAGGKSSRMGETKALLKIGNKFIIETIVDSLKPLFSEIIISSNNKELYEFLNLKIVKDDINDQGPIMGIYSSLKVSNNNINFVVTSDIPLIKIECFVKMLEYTLEYDVVIPENNGQLEPMFAIYTKRSLPYIEKILQTDSRRIISILDICKYKIVPMDMQGWYKNLNTKHDYENIVKDRPYTDPGK